MCQPQMVPEVACYGGVTHEFGRAMLATPAVHTAYSTNTILVKA